MQEQLLTYRDVQSRTGLARPTITRLVRAGDFPEPVPLTAQRVGFVESEVAAWIAQRIAQRTTPGARAERKARSKRAAEIAAERWGMAS